MKPLRLILPITLFILSGVLAWVGGEQFNKLVESGQNHLLVFWLIITFFIYFVVIGISSIWALGGLND